MKSEERKLARILRKQGKSLRFITAWVKCSKSAVSKWISDIRLTEEQIASLRSNQDRARAQAARHPNSSKQKWEKIRSAIRSSAEQDIPKRRSDEMLRVIGSALYWAEGYNASRNTVVFANSDPRMIKLMMLFFREICRVPSGKFRGKISIHPHLNISKAEGYWSKISGIPRKQFNKALIAVSRASQGKRDTLPLGTFRIIINDVYLCSRIKGWIDGLSRWTPVGG
jgi:hypothetical protein